MKKIAIAADHAGYELKEFFKQKFKSEFEFIDFGTHSSESMDYPDVIHPLCNYLQVHPHIFGVIICGSGNGVAITANKHQHIRAALCWTPELAALAKKHNNANVVSLPARFLSNDAACEILQTFVSTLFEEGRHALRVEKITAGYSC